MWTVLKFNKRELEFLKTDLSKNLSKNLKKSLDTHHSDTPIRQLCPRAIPGV